MMELISSSALVIAIICYVFYKWEIGKIKVHCHSYSKPIVGRYISFNTRDIVYECSCGKRKIERVYRSFGSPFPIETKMFITKKEIQKIANGKIHIKTVDKVR